MSKDRSPVAPLSRTTGIVYDLREKEGDEDEEDGLSFVVRRRHRHRTPIGPPTGCSGGGIDINRGDNGGGGGSRQHGRRPEQPLLLLQQPRKTGSKRQLL